MTLNPKLFILAKILIVQFLYYESFSQKENVIFRVRNTSILNNTLVCKKYFDRDSISMSADTFFIQLGNQVFINHTKYYKLIWGDKDESNGNVRVKNGTFWYRPSCKNCPRQEYKLFDFNSSNPTTILGLGGFFTKYKFTKSTERYNKKLDEYIFTFAVEDYTQVPYYYLDEITFSSQRGIIEVVMHYPHSDFKEIRCNLCEIGNKQ